MKKLAFFVLLLAMCGVAMAQDVIGEPIYYTDSTQYRPGHGMGYNIHTPSSSHRQYRPAQHRSLKENDFNKVFLESKVLLAPFDAALGLDLSYVPENWGIYASSLWGVNFDWITFGGVYRLSAPYSVNDWQAYGGLVFGPAVGFEAGIRLAFDNQLSPNNFAWWSVSMGVGCIQGIAFLNVGCSIGLSGLGTCGIFFF